MKECEALVQLDLSKIPMEKIMAIEDALHAAGIHFDTGAGFGCRDWEWDYSLQGPIKIYFKRFVEGGDQVEEENPDDGLS
ncbi:MAG: hypothetical protein ACTSX1_04465 [Candidatus Heimdallarchaeaceae archaeon]